MNGEVIIAGAIIVHAGCLYQCQTERGDLGNIILYVWGIGTMTMGWVM